MDRKKMRSWVMYDWANSAFATTMMAAVLPIFYKEVAGVGLPGNTAENYWGYTQTVAMLCVALMSPILGAVADLSGLKLRFLRLFTCLGVLSSAAFVFVGNGDYVLASVLLIIGTIGFSAGNTFYDALLTDVAPKQKRDYVSALGYAYGYIGGGILLVINLIMIEGWQLLGFPNKLIATQAVFATVAVWWFVFSLPIFRNLREPRLNNRLSIGEYASRGFGRVKHTFLTIRRYPELLKYMAAFWLFNDGINTIITMATIYGKGIGIGTRDLIIALVITQFVGIPFTIWFGRIAEKMGSKRSLYISLLIYVFVVVFGFFMKSALHFYILAFVVGMVQGGSQSVARSIYSNLVPPSRSAEFFGFLSLSSKFSSIAGPFLFALVGTLTGSSRWAILSLIFFFVFGVGILTRVDLEKGSREAYENLPLS